MFSSISKITTAGSVAILLGATLVSDNVHASMGPQGIDYTAYEDVLQTYVNSSGMVDYKALQSNREPLDGFVESLGEVTRDQYESWNTDEQIAFWLNAYNAITLKVIIDHYPLEPKNPISRMRYPNNSIRQIPGVWEDITHEVLEKELTLEQIEHEILRKDFNEPRIHLALVCAAQGCPPLRPEPWLASKIDTQYKEQAVRFFKRDSALKFENDGEQVHVSPIFKWFTKDFVEGTSKTDEDVAVLSFVKRFAPENKASQIDPSSDDLKFQDYDWSLNEQS